MRVTKLFARQVLDSRGNPTIEVEAYFNEFKASAIVPSGASTGKYEALELRDGRKEYLGKSVMTAVNNVNYIIAKKIVGMEFLNQRAVDDALIALDGTKNKSKLGANALLGVSMAVCRLASAVKQKKLYEYIAEIANSDNKMNSVNILPVANLVYNRILSSKRQYLMPIPFANVINGGKHAGSSLKIQEFMIAPVRAKNFREAVRMTSETYHVLKKIVEEKYGKSAVNVGDEGGFAPQLTTPEQALDLLVEAIKRAGYSGKVKIAIDAAASEFYDENSKNYVMDRAYTSDEMVEYYVRLLKKYPIASLEDPFDQDDLDAWAKLTVKASKLKVPIIGDDLLVTNPERIRLATEKKLCTGLLLKVNQIGTVMEAIDAARMAYDSKWIVMVSHRSGETEDTFIADLAVGLGCGHIKLGAPCRTERVAKYNQLLRIEEDKIRYARN